jgi:hypothetical protein
MKIVLFIFFFLGLVSNQYLVFQNENYLNQNIIYENDDQCFYSLGSMRKPPKNDNWDQRDDLSKLQLKYGKSISSVIKIGATFRGHKDMGNTQGSCQFWQKNYLNFVDSGWNPYIIGVGRALWDDSKNCGKCALIKNPKTGFSIISIITDFCPGCTPRQIDIQLAGSAFLASGNSLNSNPYRGGPENYNNLLLEFVECDFSSHKLEYYFDTGSSAFHWYLIIMYNTIPIDDINVIGLKDGKESFRGNIQGHDKFGRWVVEFGGNAIEGDYKINIKILDREFEDYISWNGKQHTKTSGNISIPLLEQGKKINNWPI